jgi:hypothetical protein
VTQTLSARTGSTECLLIEVEEQSGTRPLKIVLDPSTGSSAGFTFDWATGELTDLASGMTVDRTAVSLIRDKGKNGGAVWAIRCAVTPGAYTLAVQILPSDNGSTSDAVVHYVGWEEQTWASSPFDGLRGAEQPEYACPSPEESAFLLRWNRGEDSPLEDRAIKELEFGTGTLFFYEMPPDTAYEFGAVRAVLDVAGDQVTKTVAYLEEPALALECIGTGAAWEDEDGNLQIRFIVRSGTGPIQEGV